MADKNQSIAGIVFSEDRQKVLLIRRRDVPVWVLPGGGIEAGESLQEAAVREMREETGLQTSIVRKVGEYFPINRLTRHTHLFECRVITGKLSTGPETKSVAFFELDHLPRLLPPPYGDWIKDAAANNPEILRKKLSQVTYPILLKNLMLHPTLVIRFLLSRIGIYINS